MTVIRKQLIGDISTDNSTTKPLAAGDTFTGVAEEITHTGVICVNVKSDVASDTDGLKIQQSPDGIHWDFEDVFTIPAAIGKEFTINPGPIFYRIVYTNGPIDQTYFRLQCVLKRAYVKPSSHRIQDSIIGDDDAELTKSVICGESLVDGVFRNVDVTPRHNMSVSVDEFGDSTVVDSFGRLRVSNPGSLFENMMQYDLNPLNFSNSTTGAGSITHLPNESAAQLSTGGTTSGDKAIFQTKRYHRYQAGKSQLVLMTANLGSAKANVRQRIGLFDTANGLYFEQTLTAKYVGIRTSTSGSPVDTTIAQSSWNIDAMDGTGFSKVTIDWTKAQIFIIDYQWLGVGRIRFGFDIDGQIVYCHEILNSNVNTTVYMTTPHLPMRVEIENTGTAASATTLKSFCMNISSEGGKPEEPGAQFAQTTGVTSKAVTTRVPIISLRPSVTFNSITNRGHVIFSEVAVIAATNNCLFELVYNGTLTGASWTNVNATYSISDYDTSATAISGGIIKNYGFAIAGIGASNGGLFTNSLPLELYNDYAGTTPDIITLVATSFTGTSNINANIRWTEQR